MTILVFLLLLLERVMLLAVVIGPLIVSSLSCIRHWRSASTLSIRYPDATRPWQHVLEPITGYMQLALHLSASRSLNGESFNFGPNPSEIYSVADVVSHISKSLSGGLIFSAERTQDIKESSLLSLDSTKATSLLGWRPSLANIYQL